MTEVELKQVDVNITKLLAETEKLISERELLGKKSRWFEILLAVAITAILVKFF